MPRKYPYNVPKKQKKSYSGKKKAHTFKVQAIIHYKTQQILSLCMSKGAIQCSLIIKSLFRLSLRMVTGFVQSLIQLSGLSWTAPDYSTLCRRQKQIDIAISYQKSHEGLHLLVDSTGLKFLGEGE